MPAVNTSKPNSDFKRIYRSQVYKIIGGVAGGLGEYFGIDPNIIRFIFILLTVFGGSGVITYLALWIILPVENGYTHASGENIKKNTEEIKKRVGEFTNRIKMEYRDGTSKTWWGILIAALGLIFLFNNFGFLHFFSTFWPLILIMIGLSVLFK